MAIPKRLEIIFHNHQPDGIRTYMSYLSPVTTFLIPRPLLTKAKNLSNINNPGIYYLFNENDGALSEVYIGQTRNGIQRIMDHNVNKEFWNKCVLFLSDDTHFNLNIISGLEKHAILKAKEAKRYTVINKVVPQFRIPDIDFPIIEEIYEEIEFILATLGYKMSPAEQNSNVVVYHTTRRGITAYGTYDGEKFELLPGSEIDIKHPAHMESLNVKRKSLLATGVISQTEIGKFILNSPVEFKSPSSAASFVLGGSVNGWTELKNDKNVTMNDCLRINEKEKND